MSWEPEDRKRRECVSKGEREREREREREKRSQGRVRGAQMVTIIVKYRLVIGKEKKGHTAMCSRNAY